MRRNQAPALHTGQRSSDLIKIRWDDYDGSAIQVTQEKTGSRLWVPCHEDLKVELTEWKRNATSVTILVNPASGEPWNRIGFSNAVRLSIKAHPEGKGYVFHGLRKAFASPMVEAGCSVLEIAVVTGHMSLKKPRNSHISGGPATKGERHRTKLEKPPTANTEKLGR